MKLSLDDDIDRHNAQKNQLFPLRRYEFETLGVAKQPKMTIQNFLEKKFWYFLVPFFVLSFANFFAGSPTDF